MTIQRVSISCPGQCIIACGSIDHQTRLIHRIPVHHTAISKLQRLNPVTTTAKRMLDGDLVAGRLPFIIQQANHDMMTAFTADMNMRLTNALTKHDLVIAAVIINYILTITTMENVNVVTVAAFQPVITPTTNKGVGKPAQTYCPADLQYIITIPSIQQVVAITHF